MPHTLCSKYIIIKIIYKMVVRCKWRHLYLSMLIAARLRMDAVQHMTSNATQASHRASPSIHTPSFTCNRISRTDVITIRHATIRLTNGFVVYNRNELIED